MRYIYILQFVLSTSVLVAWYLRRPSKCSTCGVRQPTKGAYCFSCGASMTLITPSRSRTEVNLGAAANPPSVYRQVAAFAAVVALYLSSLLVIQPTSHLWYLGLAVFCLSGIAVIGVSVSKAQRCEACGSNTLASQVPKSGNPHCPNCGARIRFTPKV